MKVTETANKAFTAPTHVIAPHSWISGTEDVKSNSKSKDVQQPKKKVGAESKEERKSERYTL